MANDPSRNPYAPPAAAMEVPRGSEARDTSRAYEDERRSVLLMFALTVVTLGFYPAVWFFRRRRFLDGLASERKLGALAAAPLAASVLSFAFGVVSGLVDVPTAFDRMVTMVSGVTTIVTAFRVAAILRSDFARTGRFLSVSGPGTFFLNAFYLQHKINQAARTRARTPAEARA